MSPETTSSLNVSASSATLSSAGAGIVGGYNGNSHALRVLIIFFPALAIYNVVELLILIFVTFNKYAGLYFWSLLIASLGIIPYSLGFMFKFNNITVGDLRWLSVILLTVGWYAMVTGQAVVLWSRLHLLVTGVKGERTLKWTKWMIISNAIILHIPTTILTFGSNGEIRVESFVRGYNVMEKIQMSGFFVQEVILSTLYIIAAIKILRTSVRDDTKKIMHQLFAINVLIIVMDLALLGLEAASLYILETTTKGVFYSVKLKLEFAILGKLVQFVGRPGTSIANDRRLSVQFPEFDVGLHKSGDSSLSTSVPIGITPAEISDFVDLSKIVTGPTCQSPNPDHSERSHTANDITRATVPLDARVRKPSIRLASGMSPSQVNLALFQHTDSVTLPANN